MKVPVIVLPSGQHFCGVCGATMRFDDYSRSIDITRAAFSIARCRSWSSCAMYDVAVKIPINRIECDIADEENPRVSRETTDTR